MTEIRIVEYNDYHYDVLPTWVYIYSSFVDPKRIKVFSNFDNFGKSITPFFNLDLSLKSVFLFSSQKNLIWKVIRYPFKLLVRSLFRITKYPDLNDNLFFRSFIRGKSIIVFNSIEPLKVLEKAIYFAKKNFKILVILHNGDLIYKKKYKDFLHLKNVKVFALSELVRDYLIGEGLIKVKLMAPVFFNHKNIEHNNSRTTFTVQGNVNFRRRNYTSLIKAVEKLVKVDKLENFIVKILGNSNTAEGKIIKDEINNKKLEKYFYFFDQKLDYQKFYNEVQISDYLLVLQDTTSITYSPYFKFKSSAVINVSLGFNKIMIMHKEQSEINKLEKMSILYEDDNLRDAMLYALNMPGEKRKKMESLLVARRKMLLKKSVSNVNKVLNQ